MALLGQFLLLPSQTCRANLVWEEHYADEAAILDGSSIVTPDGRTVTFNRTISSDNTGGTFDLDPGGNHDYFTFEQGPLGGDHGHLELSFDNQNNDSDDYLELSLNFDRAVSNLRFSVLDIDSGSWDDGVEVFYNGSNNVRDNPAIATTLGSYVGLDSKSYLHGWEGIGRNAGNGQTAGNLDLDFGALQISSLTFRFFSTEDASNNPRAQEIGLSDLFYTEAVPEPSAMACMGVFAVLMLGLHSLRGRTPKRPPSTDHLAPAISLSRANDESPSHADVQRESRCSRSAGVAA